MQISITGSERLIGSCTIEVACQLDSFTQSLLLFGMHQRKQLNTVHGYILCCCGTENRAETLGSSKIFGVQGIGTKQSSVQSLPSSVLTNSCLLLWAHPMSSVTSPQQQHIIQSYVLRFQMKPHLDIFQGGKNDFFGLHSSCIHLY